MKTVQDITLLLAVLGLIAAAALSGVWMKKDDKPPKRDLERGGSVNVYIVVPPASAPRVSPPSAPEGRRYPI